MNRSKKVVLLLLACAIGLVVGVGCSTGRAYARKFVDQLVENNNKPDLEAVDRIVKATDSSERFYAERINSLRQMGEPVKPIFDLSP